MTYRCKVSPDLLNAEVDEGQFRQVINNIIINGIESMPNGGKIIVSAKNCSLKDSKIVNLPKGKYIKISIKDNGIGIPENILHKIFDPYFSTKDGGSGLGLTISHSIIKKHNGQITVESKQDVGSTFNIYLPASKKKLLGKENAKEEFKIESPDTKGKILLMDDEKSIVEISKLILEKLDYEIVTAKDGEEAIEKYIAAEESGEPFDVIILDLTVPGGLGGKETIERIQEQYPGAKAIVSSGYYDDPIMADYKDYGFSGVLPKPYKIRNLIKIISDVINS